VPQEPLINDNISWEPRPIPTFEEFRSQLTQDITRRDFLSTSIEIPDSFTLQSPWHKESMFFALPVTQLGSACFEYRGSSAAV
jgi:hypothetical protein